LEDGERLVVPGIDKIGGGTVTCAAQGKGVDGAGADIQGHIVIAAGVDGYVVAGPGHSCAPLIAITPKVLAANPDIRAGAGRNTFCRNLDKAADVRVKRYPLFRPVVEDARTRRNQVDLQRRVTGCR